ncbi:A disintegrin and metalloproteinase with thrombospondin motifs 4 isoform X2 [Mustela lutreola]|uniref:A disintegrin and metalloproteinase with thrombospondin motifs 4 isoform X2 n=1 Tax=Mustela lutreola TaxID=9666 RepID=UPI0027979908|nr:A disintegrin and metalloproteinase with thrombospondin motifs 4 isoform X2 [Mustela lutreola]
MSRTDWHPRRSLARCWLWGVHTRPMLPTVPNCRPVGQLLLLLLASLLPSARPASPLPREEEIVFPEKLNGSVLPGSGAPARLLYRLPAFGETLLLELEQDPGVRVEGLTVQYLGQAPELLGGAEPGTYLTGTVNGDPESVASLHWDGGALLGVLQYRGTELHIQPLEGGTLNSAGGPGAHILRRKSPASSQGPMCNVKAPPGNPSPSPRRAKRFASLSRFVETLVVADDKMAAFHGAGLKRYLLTVMAAAAKAFKHPSIRNPVSLVVTRLVILGPGEEGPQVGPSAAQTLRSFCAWQRGLNTPEDSDPDHFDTAILFTRQDLCGVSTCDTLGMADVGTVCDPARSCAIVEDDGLQSAFTAAHELGHVFNMLHDNSKPCVGLNGPGSTSRHVMAPVMAHVDPEEPWSPCSARFITDFLDNGYGHCLLDKPAAPLHLPVTFPGKDYDADRQCQLTFGPDSRHCPQLPPPCAALWCSGHLNGHAMCQTKHSPWADGTPCGPAQACMGGRCLHADQLQDFNIPQAGGWGPWGSWGDCSRSCGGGVQFSSRDCTRPVPRNGGKYCEGRRTRFRSCNTQDCPTGSALTFRDEQCAAFNHRTDLFKSFPGPMDWVPRYTGVAPRDQCKLTCQARALGYYYVLEPRVVDGTPCSPDSSSVCVQGRCIHAGCDRVIGSKKKFDKCMVCGGDGSSCSKQSGSFRKFRCGPARGRQPPLQRRHGSLGDAGRPWAAGPAAHAAGPGGRQPPERSPALQLLRAPASAVHTAPPSAGLAAPQGSNSGDPPAAPLGGQEITSSSPLPCWAPGPRTGWQKDGASAAASRGPADTQTPRGGAESMGPALLPAPDAQAGPALISCPGRQGRVVDGRGWDTVHIYTALSALLVTGGRGKPVGPGAGEPLYLFSIYSLLFSSREGDED